MWGVGHGAVAARCAAHKVGLAAKGEVGHTSLCMRMCMSMWMDGHRNSSDVHVHVHVHVHAWVYAPTAVFAVGRTCMAVVALV